MPTAPIQSTPPPASVPSRSTSTPTPASLQPAATLPPTPLVQVEPTTAPFCVDTRLDDRLAATSPTLSPISFATQRGPDGWPLDTSLQFTTAATRVLASFGYYGLRDGLAWERVWYFGDPPQRVSSGSGVWDAGPQGELTVHAMAGEGGFEPGRYRLEIYVAGQLLGQGEFRIVEEDASTRRPVQVAYTTWDGAAHRIDLLDLESEEPQSLLKFARGPAWSPDAKGLLFLAEDGFAAGPAGLWVQNMDLNRPFPINEESFFRAIAWSPARTYVATSLADGPTPRLALWDLFESKAYPGPLGEDPAWSPEGRRLAFRGCDREGWHISTVHVVGNVLDTRSIRRLTLGDDSQPAWSWDGQRIAFVRREDGNQDIYTIAPDGGEPVRLTDDPAIDTAPAWTPDNRLLFRSFRGGQWGLYIMNADGSGQRRLASTPSRPDWQPDRPAVSTDVLLVEPELPKSRIPVPAGQGVLVISNQPNNDEMTFTIADQEHRIPPFEVKILPLAPGQYTWTASWPGKTGRSGSTVIVAGQVSYPVAQN